MKCLAPLMTQSPPSRWALVVIERTSEPAPGSVIARQSTRSPRTVGSRYVSTCPSRQACRMLLGREVSGVQASRDGLAPDLPHQLLRHRVQPFDQVLVRDQLAGDEVAHRRGYRPLLFAELKVHGLSFNAVRSSPPSSACPPSSARP